MSHLVNDSQQGGEQPPTQQRLNIRVLQGKEKHGDTDVIDTKYAPRTRLYVLLPVASPDINKSYYTVVLFEADTMEALESKYLSPTQAGESCHENRVFDLPDGHKRFVKWRIYRNTHHDIHLYIESHVLVTPPDEYDMDDLEALL